MKKINKDNPKEIEDWLKVDQSEDKWKCRHAFFYDLGDQILLRLMGRMLDGRRMTKYFEVTENFNYSEVIKEWLKVADLEE